MGQKVAQGEGLTSRQKKFLAVVLQAPYILKKFYLSGGTALSSWYLHHRDSFDLYFILKQENYPIDQLRKDAAIKHGVRPGTIQVAKQFLRSPEFTDTPKIIVPFDKKEMDNFFSDLAKSLEDGIFK